MHTRECNQILHCVQDDTTKLMQLIIYTIHNSETANMIEEGVADLHCRSDKYLAEEIWNEHQEAGQSMNEP